MGKIVDKIAHNTFYNLINNLILLSSGILISVVIARFIAPEQLGTYYLAAFVIGVVGLICNLGLPNVALKYISEFSSENQRDVRAGLAKYVIKIKIGVTLISLLILIFFSRNIGDFYRNQDIRVYLLLMSIGFLPTSITAVFSGIVSGLQRYRYLSVRSLILNVTNLALLLLLLKNGYGILGVIWTSIFVGILDLALYLCYFKFYKVIDFEQTYSMGSDLKSKIFTYNWQVALIIFVDMIIWQRSEIFFLGKFSSKSEVAFYSIAYDVASKFIIFLPNIFAATLLPVMSELYGKKDVENLKKVFVYSTRYIMLAVVPLGVLIFAFTDTITLFLYGEGYLKVAGLLKILLVSAAFGVIASPAASSLYSTEKQSVILKWGSAIAVINIILDFTLIPKFGATGAAYANSCCQVLGVLVGITYVCGMLKVKFPTAYTFKILAASSLALVPAVFFKHCGMINIAGLGLSFVSGFLVYFISLIYLRAYDETDIGFFRILWAKIKQVLNPRKCRSDS